MELIKSIEKARPNLKSNSINAYIIALKKLNNNETIKDLNFLTDKSKIKKHLEKLKITTRRNYLTAILVGLSSQDANESLINYYRNYINKINEEYTNEMMKNNKSDKQEENWVKLSELTDIFNDYEKKVKSMDLKNKIKITPSDFNILQEYLVTALYTLLPPVRLDFAPMYIVNSKKKMKENINYLVNLSRNKKIFVIQEYKNVKSKGIHEIKIPSKLNSIINLWLKYNTTDMFLLNNRKSILSANGLGKMITKVFKPTGKQITINLLRSIYITENVDIDAVKKSQKLADDMGHSVKIQQTVYYKDD